MQKQLKIYFKAIKKNLPCYNKAMRTMLDDLKVSVDAYIDENGITEFAEIENHFGTAENIAKEFAVGLDGAYIKSYRFKKRVTTIVVSLLVAILIAVSALVIYIIADSENNQPAYYNDGIIYKEEL